MSTPFSVETSVGTLSGRAAGPQQTPRGLVVALHGGTYDSAYYAAAPGSLLDLADSLGLRVVALDRPGYGAAASMDPSRFTFAAQGEIIAEAVNTMIADTEPVDGTVLIGHSIGGMVALQAAATGRIALRGVEVSGIGARWRPGMVEMWGSFVGDVPAIEVPAEPHAQVMFGPEGTFDPALRAADAGLIRPMSMPELVDVVAWTDTFAGVAAGIDVPVRVSFPEHDNIWETDDDARALAGALFVKSPEVETVLVRGAGHCTELHKPGRSYVLAQLSLAERYLAA